ncbi:aminoglycoside 6-adenylyltransferase [Lapidilactobacillus luobeiensis]|uniref:aminoglycoside 6-adenylyltransferase n=1 Tax=Lapidilactobacillus luobeiensis TaxID=2950371 RepID=UPI0021C2BCD7|nr:aminoglycoside 6-adenylyltransferase [Lapidilactobacillus luobeiensis]
MRSSTEMFALILKKAQTDPRIRAVYLEGSRVNPSVPNDIFQDYDIAYVVDDIKPFYQEQAWLDQFGPRLYWQLPDDNAYFPLAEAADAYGWLIQFADGNRLDLHVRTLDNALNHLEMYQILLDKDHCLPQPIEVTDQRYWVQRPSIAEFRGTCNEFWWCLNNVAKGLWRQELPYVLDMLDFNVRPMLKQILNWQIGATHDFQISVGKNGKYYRQLLPAPIYQQFLATYATGDITALWSAVTIMCDLFQAVASQLSQQLNFTYDQQEATNSRLFLDRVRQLPPDAKGIDQ